MCLQVSVQSQSKQMIVRVSPAAGAAELRKGRGRAQGSGAAAGMAASCVGQSLLYYSI